MRKQYWFLLVLVVIGATGLGIYGIKRWRANRPVVLAEGERISVTDAERPELVDDEGNAKGFPWEDAQASLDYMLTDEYANLSEEEKQRYREQLADAYNASLPEIAILVNGEDILDPANEKYTQAQQAYLKQEVDQVHNIADERAKDSTGGPGGGEWMDGFLSMSREEQNAEMDPRIDWLNENRAMMRQWRRTRFQPEPATEYPTRIQRRRSHQDPLQRAKWAEIMNRFDERCEERGVRLIRIF